MRTVELRTAYCWHCDECSELNFCESEIYETTGTEKEEIYRYFNGLDEDEELPDRWHEFETVCRPDIVKCNKCGTEFEAKDELDPDDEDEAWTITDDIQD